jgi:hypothetical protein
MASPNSTFSSDTYVPLLKSKQGELGALGWVTARDRLVPLLEVRDPARQAQAISNAWPDPNHALLVHPLDVDEHDDADWVALVDALFDVLRTNNLAFVPVVTTDDSPAVVNAVGSAVAQDGRGACIRLDAETFALTPPATAANEVAQLLAAIGIAEGEVDLVVDGGLLRNSLASRVTTVESALNAIPNLGAWRNLVVAYSAFPESIADVAAANSVTQLSRDDALAFATLLNRNPARVPNYGDYAVGTPFYADISWAPIPAIRYASDDSWYVHRAASKKDRSAKYIQLSADVVGSTHFAGAAASRGDAYLNDVANGADGPGTPMTYVRAATSRHMACVLDRLATLGVP